jgi:hypothetical protein
MFSLTLGNRLVLKRKICYKQWKLIGLSQMCSEFLFLNLDSNEFSHNFKECNLYLLFTQPPQMMSECTHFIYVFSRIFHCDQVHLYFSEHPC